MESALGKRNFSSSSIPTSNLSAKNEIKFKLEGEACGPRTELWSGYLEENGEISMIAGKSVLLRCSKENWPVSEDGNRSGDFILNVYQSNSTKWVGFEPVQWNFNQPFRLSFVETKNVGYFVEVLTLDKKLAAKTPVIRLFTERWFREKTKRQSCLTPLKDFVIGEFQSDLTSAQHKITDLGRKVQMLDQQLSDARREIQALRSENQKLHEENKELRELFANFSPIGEIQFDQFDPESNLTSPPSYDLSSPSLNFDLYSQTNSDPNMKDSIQFGGELTQITPTDSMIVNTDDYSDLNSPLMLHRPPPILSGGDDLGLESFELPANPSFNQNNPNNFEFFEEDPVPEPPAKKFQQIFTPGGTLLIPLMDQSSNSSTSSLMSPIPIPISYTPLTPFVEQPVYSASASVKDVAPSSTISFFKKKSSKEKESRVNKPEEKSKEDKKSKGLFRRKSSESSFNPKSGAAASAVSTPNYGTLPTSSSLSQSSSRNTSSNYGQIPTNSGPLSSNYGQLPSNYGQLPSVADYGSLPSMELSKRSQLEPQPPKVSSVMKPESLSEKTLAKKETAHAPAGRGGAARGAPVPRAFQAAPPQRSPPPPSPASSPASPPPPSPSSYFLSSPTLATPASPVQQSFGAVPKFSFRSSSVVTEGSHRLRQQREMESLLSESVYTTKNTDQVEEEDEDDEGIESSDVSESEQIERNDKSQVEESVGKIQQLPLATQVFAKIVEDKTGLKLAVLNRSSSQLNVKYHLHFQEGNMEASIPVSLKPRGGFKGTLPLGTAKGTVTLKIIVSTEDSNPRSCVLVKSFEAPQKSLEDDPLLEEDLATYNMKIPEFPSEPETIESIGKLSLK